MFSLRLQTSYSCLRALKATRIATASFSTSAKLEGRRSRGFCDWYDENFSIKKKGVARFEAHPYDARFDVSPREVMPLPEDPTKRLWANDKVTEDFARDYPWTPREPVITDTQGKKHLVPEMIPEFVVPDLSKFKLKPYVSYKVKDIHQSQFTSKDLFDAVYAQDIVKDYSKGNLDPESLTVESVLNAKDS